MSNERKKLSNSIWVGALILLVGSLILIDRMDLLEVPWWLFSWKTFLIGLGIVIGINRNFEGLSWLIMILVGGFFLLDDVPGFPFDLDRYAFPIGVIIIGVFIIARAITGSSRKEEQRKKWGEGVVTMDEGGEDFFDLTTVFGGNKRRVFSKKFKGGSTTCVFGGTDIDLSQADIEGTAVIDVVQLFGGVKIIIPSNWELKSEVTAILGGVDDKRPTLNNPATGKRLVLTGFVMFGGVDIKSYN
jgi:predicted membrane protein